MISTRCAVCDTLDNADQLYPARFTEADLNARVFSARRVPDRLHFRIVRCRGCGLLRSDPVAEPGRLAHLYEGSTFDYGAELPHLRSTYRRYLERLPVRGALLEIGCGNGFMLEEARSMGFEPARGVEPSADAVARSLRPGDIVRDVMRPGLFEPATFAAIAMFQVLDHLPDPGGVLAECGRVLRDDGHVLLLQHDARAWSARLLGERSPIIDIEHTYLYDSHTLTRLCRKHALEPVETGVVWNTYSIGYIARLAGLTLPLATPVSVPLGNFYMIARKT